MDNALMIGLSRQMTLRQSLDIVANNIANANTAGFKVESLLLEETPAPTAEHQDGPGEIHFAEVWGMARDFRQGELQYTGRTFDLAIDGDGFFAVENANGEEYTRDGRFHIDDLGQLVTHDGAPVLDANTRAPIILNPGAEQVQIVDGGAIIEDGVEVGRIGVFNIENRGELSKQGNGRYTLPNGAPEDLPQAAFDPSVQQGYVESSNVQAVIELTDMMNITRAYERVSKFLSDTHDLNRKALERLGKA
ncbi:MAG: flagellar basal-body rod protein FlgF [Alphaproteobacteria bacterium]|nr:flagellar basal-body rod protein FlgF [Alphaproteobacteria bacterium]